MNGKIVSILLIAAGLALVIIGSRREDSVAGISDSVITDVANTIDGKARLPEHIWYYVGGGALMLIGIFGAVRRAKS